MHYKIHFEQGENGYDTEVAVIIVINSQVKKIEDKYLTKISYLRLKASLSQLLASLLCLLSFLSM